MTLGMIMNQMTVFISKWMESKYVAGGFIHFGCDCMLGFGC